MYLPEAIPLPWRVLKCLESARFACPTLATEFALPLSRGNSDGRCIRLLALGDLALCNVPSNDPSAVFGDLMPHLARADLRTVNLEAQLSTVPDPEWIAGQALRSPPSALPILVGAGIDVVNVANNHAFDLGVAGLQESLKALSSVGIDACGVARGSNMMAVRTANGMRIGLLGGCDDHESLPPEEVARADLPVLCTDDAVANIVAELRRQVDLLVVHLHWGYEFTLYPLVEHQTRARTLVDHGAHLVLCHHAHVPQGIEHYGRGVIAYGLGNAWMPILPYLADGHPWAYRSFALEAECTAGSVTSVRLIPFEIKPGGAISVLQGEHRRRLLRAIGRISARLHDRELLRRFEIARAVYELDRMISNLDELMQGSDLGLLRGVRKLELPRQRRLLTHARELPGCERIAPIIESLVTKLTPAAIRSAWYAAQPTAADTRRVLRRTYRWRDALLARTP